MVHHSRCSRFHTLKGTFENIKNTKFMRKTNSKGDTAYSSFVLLIYPLIRKRQQKIKKCKLKSLVAFTFRLIPPPKGSSEHKICSVV
jgi:hypothetical protein